MVKGNSLFAVVFKNNKIQDWLDRCCWGRLDSQQYENMSLELRQLDLAIGG